MFGRKQTYCLVRFPGSRRCCYYRTTDTTLASGDVVVVPAPDREGQKKAVIVSVERYKPSDLLRAARRTKKIIRKAGWRESQTVRRQLDSESSLTIDISQRSVKTIFGYKMVPLTRKERERLRERYEQKYPEVICIETVPAPREAPLAWIERDGGEGRQAGPAGQVRV